jgi:Tfp pilus assembly protein PilO
MKAEMMVKRLPQQRAEVGELQDTADVRVKDIPRALDHTWLSRQISLAAGETGVSDVSQRIVSGAAPLKMDKELQEKFSEKIWEVRLRGDYHEVGKFLNKLEGANAFLEVTDINVEGNDPGGQKVAVTLRYLVKKEGTGG